MSLNAGLSSRLSACPTRSCRPALTRLLLHSQPEIRIGWPLRRRTESAGAVKSANWKLADSSIELVRLEHLADGSEGVAEISDRDSAGDVLVEDADSVAL